MNNILTHTSEFGEVRTVEIQGEIWFVGKDVAECLGYADQNKAIQMHVDTEDKLNDKTALSLGQRGGWLINESGLYSLIMSSKLPTAKAFKHWVTSEVLPSIRKHGAYMTPDKIEEFLFNPDTLIKLAQNLKAEQEKNVILNNIIEMNAPQVHFAKSITASGDCISVNAMAKILKQNGIETGQNRFYGWLRDNGYLSKQIGDNWNLPTQKAMDLKLFRIQESETTKPTGEVKINRVSKVTAKGQEYFVNKLIGMEAVALC